jgi:hypothetical protein
MDVLLENLRKNSAGINNVYRIKNKRRQGITLLPYLNLISIILCAFSWGDFIGRRIFNSSFS